MKRQIAILLMVILIVAPIIQDVSAAKTVFITSDTIIDHDNDIKMLNSIKSYIEEISGGELQVIVDNQAPAPGEEEDLKEAHFLFFVNANTESTLGDWLNNI